MTDASQPRRNPNDSDRLINVYGYSDAFMDAILPLVDDIHNPGYLFCIGSERCNVELVRNVKRARPDLDDKYWLASKPSIERNGAKIAFSLASAECAKDLIRLVNTQGVARTEKGEEFIGKVKAILLFHQQDKEQFLPDVLNHCDERVKVYRIIGNEPSGRIEAASWEYAVPSSVDLTASASDDDAILRAMPDAAMFGKCGEIAKLTRCPLGYAYLASLAAASVFVSGNCNIRPNLFVGLLGDVHTGKSLAAQRALMLLGLQDAQDSPIGDYLSIGTPASDRGLYKLFPEREFVRRLHYEDEGRAFIGKGNIQGSTLISNYCALWSRTRAGVADKFGISALNVQLSLLANFKVRDQSEFPDIFTHATSHGLWDRFLFGSRGSEQWRYTPWDFEAERDVTKLDPTIPHVPAELFETAHKWSASGEDRDRLAENALRVAYVTSAANRDMQVSCEALEAALQLMKWQEEIRTIFQPAKGANEAEECVRTILDAFKRAPGHSFNFRDMARKHHWYEKFARTLAAAKSNLMKERVIVLDPKTKRHYLNEEVNK